MKTQDMEAAPVCPARFASLNLSQPALGGSSYQGNLTYTGHSPPTPLASLLQGLPRNRSQGTSHVLKSLASHTQGERVDKDKETFTKTPTWPQASSVPD